jgi:hypothetical protein
MAEEIGKPGELLSPKDMGHFLNEEITQLAKGTELRLRELTQLVTAYAAGEITPEAANKRFEDYYDRWGDALPGGVMITQGHTDKEILSAIGGGTLPFTEREKAAINRVRRTTAEKGPPEILR